MAKDKSKDRPSRTRENQLPAPSAPRNFDEATPKFCLAHLAPSFGIVDLPEDRQRSEFAKSIERLSKMTWRQIRLAYKHGNGSEPLPKNQILRNIPERFADQEKFVVLRYDGNLPMVGVRIEDTFHVIWVEAAFGDVYDHGSK